MVLKVYSESTKPPATMILVAHGQGSAYESYGHSHAYLCQSWKCVHVPHSGECLVAVFLHAPSESEGLASLGQSADRAGHGKTRT